MTVRVGLVDACISTMERQRNCQWGETLGAEGGAILPDPKTKGYPRSLL